MLIANVFFLKKIERDSYHQKWIICIEILNIEIYSV